MEMTDKIIANLILCFYEKKATGDFEGKEIEGDQVKLYENIKIPNHFPRHTYMILKILVTFPQVQQPRHQYFL